MFNLVRKDFLSLSKSKNDLFELLLMPLILVIILGFALGNVLSGDYSINSFSIGLVNEQQTTTDLEQLEMDLIDLDYPEEVIQQLLETAEETDPTEMLTTVLNDEGFNDLIMVEEFEDKSDAEEALINEEITGYIIFPENFNYNLWLKMLLNEDVQAELDVRVLTEDSFYGNILISILSSFIEEYNLESSIALATNGEATAEVQEQDFGEIIQFSVEDPVNSFQYYTIGMGVMYALFIASTVANRAYHEKEQHVFGRIMLSGKKPLTYLMSKFVSGTMFAFLQLMILFVMSTLIFGTFADRTMTFWTDLVWIVGIYSLGVGSITALLTSISLYANDVTTVSFFSSFVSVLSFLGGSFTPVDQFSEGLAQLGSWTPNGAIMTVLIQLTQGFAVDEMISLLSRVVIMTIIFLTIAVVVFPKRRLD